MANILYGDAKVQVNLIDKSVYSPVVGGNIVAILGVFEDGDTEQGTYISSRSELNDKLGSPVTKYNSGTKINYAYDALHTALGQHNAIWVLRVTDGTEKSGEFAPQDSIFKVVTKNKTARWNGVSVGISKIVANYSNPDGTASPTRYEIRFMSSDKTSVLETYTGNLRPDSDEYLLNVVNTNSLRFKLVETKTIEDATQEITSDQLKLSAYTEKTTPFKLKLYKGGSVSDLEAHIRLRSGSSRKSAKIITTKLESTTSTNQTSWSINTNNEGIMIDVTNDTNIKLSSLYSIVNSYVAYEMNIIDKSGNIVDLPKAERSKYTINLGSLTTESYESSEVVTTQLSSTLTQKVGTKEITSTSNNIISGGKSGLEDIGPDDFIRQAELLEDASKYKINLVAAPGITDAIVHKFIDSVINNRGRDAMQIVDIPNYADVTTVINNTSIYNSKYMMIYHPWIEGVTSKGVKSILPPSGEVLQTIGYSDANGEPWFAPAGLRRGTMLTATGVSRTLSQGDRDRLQAYPEIINPIVIEEGGVVIWGNTTAYRVSSKLREISVMRLAIYLTKTLKVASKQYLFEPNSGVTHDQWKLDAESIMQDVFNRQGVYSYQIKLGEKDGTMGSYEIDRNIAKAVVKFKPVGYMHWFVVDMEVHKHGSSYTVTTE